MNYVGCWRCHVINNWMQYQEKRGDFSIWLCVTATKDLHGSALESCQLR